MQPVLIASPRACGSNHLQTANNHCVLTSSAPWVRQVYRVTWGEITSWAADPGARGPGPISSTVVGGSMDMHALTNA